MLRVDGLSVRYGPVEALSDVSLTVGRGEAVCLLGSNGAGKTTLIRTLAGLVQPSGGRISFEDVPLDSKPPEFRANAGIAVVFEGRGMLSAMTVRENLLMGGYLRRQSELAHDIEQVFAQFPRLAERQHQLAGTLSGGEQQMVAIGRALMARPKIVLMDEPSMGLAPVVVEQVFEIVAGFVRQGIALLLVEQNVHMAIENCARFYVLGKGRMELTGSINAGVLVSDDGRRLAEADLETAYLGG
ncbi:ABC transporter ATP-binding protein [Bradyrhizobium sp. NP1]|uniref:ABC transporter ATP-binding protein n=1 Tax=Bradyrhizobium sp. NP1 TaxID=3049772 RepID=UPI0025A5273E|nr:ABC transporter ATP-binding protein [Bradyrhizobium sp. NP1]WJR76630.1 ABC transporter ATP-binding protein [Bradyrhizobium sp. NP1]